MLLASAGWAQSRPTVIDHPLEVKGAFSPAQRTQLRLAFRKLVAERKGVLVPAATGWTMAVQSLAQSDCAVSDACLQQLALLGGCTWALFVSVEANAARTEVQAVGRVVGPAGVAAQGEVKMKFRRATAALPKAARVALAQLLDELAPEKLPLGAPPGPGPVAVVPTAAPAEAPGAELASELAPFPVGGAEVEPLPPPPPPPPFDAPLAPVRTSRGAPGSPALRGLGVVSLGVSAATMGVGLAFGISALQDQQRLPEDGRLLDAAQVQEQLSIDRKATAALGLGIGAVALAATGGVLLLASMPRRSPAVAVVPTGSGAALSVSGRF